MSRGVAVYGVLQHVRPVVLESTRVVESRVRDLGWTVGSRAVAELLTHRGPLTVPRLADELSLARQNVQRHVDELVGQGHARALPNPAHRRSVLIELTATGRAAFDRLHADELADLASLAGGCSDQELATAARVLAAIGRDLRARVTG